MKYFREEIALFQKTLSGKIIALNLLIFILMCVQDFSFLRPSYDILISWGAKDSVLLAKGEWWRLITANFVHFGLLHLWLNLYALKIIGPRIEEAIGPSVFISIYLLSGVFSVISSSFFHLSVSAGASGALFGLIGVGLAIEHLQQKSLSLEQKSNSVLDKNTFKWFITNRPYLFVALINILLAIVINTLLRFFGIKIKIDNAAHLSGLFSGILLFILVLKLYFQNLSLLKKIKYYLLALVFFGFFIFLGQTLIKGDFLEKKFISQARTTTDQRHAFFLYSQALSINPSNKLAYFARGRLLWLNQEYAKAMKDFKISLDSSHQIIQSFDDFSSELLDKDPNSAKLLQDFLIYENSKNLK